MNEQDNIDFNKLSQRELLIVTHKKVDDIARAMESLTREQAKHEVRISVVEQKVMMWGALFGSIGGIVAAVVASLIMG